MDPVAKLAELRQKYPNVTIQGRSIPIHIPKGEGLIAQYWLKADTVKCRMARPHKTHYISVLEFEPALVQAMHSDRIVKSSRNLVVGPKDLSPMKYGRGLIAMLGGASKWCGSKFMAVSLPEQAEFMLPSWRGWVRFQEWTGHNPTRRRWSETQRYLLISSGQYAWQVLMDRGANQAKVIYSGGASVQFESAWFSLSRPEEFQRTLIQVSQHADEKKWRDKEMVGLDLDRVDLTVSSPTEKRNKQRAERKAARVEVTRVPDAEDEFTSDPTAPQEWDGDLTKRYTDED